MPVSHPWSPDTSQILPRSSAELEDLLDDVGASLHECRRLIAIASDREALRRELASCLPYPRTEVVEILGCSDIGALIEQPFAALGVVALARFGRTVVQPALDDVGVGSRNRAHSRLVQLLRLGRKDCWRLAHLSRWHQRGVARFFSLRDGPMALLRIGQVRQAAERSGVLDRLGLGNLRCFAVEDGIHAVLDAADGETAIRLSLAGDRLEVVGNHELGARAAEILVGAARARPVAFIPQHTVLPEARVRDVLATLLDRDDGRLTLVEAIIDNLPLPQSPRLVLTDTTHGDLAPALGFLEAYVGSAFECLSDIRQLKVAWRGYRLGIRPLQTKDGWVLQFWDSRVSGRIASEFVTFMQQEFGVIPVSVEVSCS